MGRQSWWLQGGSFHSSWCHPQCPRDQRWNAQQLGVLISQLEARYSVDKDRIYVTGLSMGATGTWALVASDPARFAAIAPVCGRGDPETAKSFASTPIWVFHGAKDPTVPILESQRMVDALKVAGGSPNLRSIPMPGMIRGQQPLHP